LEFYNLSFDFFIPVIGFLSADGKFKDQSTPDSGSSPGMTGTEDASRKEPKNAKRGINFFAFEPCGLSGYEKSCVEASSPDPFQSKFTLLLKSIRSANFVYYQ